MLFCSVSPCVLAEPLYARIYVPLGSRLFIWKKRIRTNDNFTLGYSSAIYAVQVVAKIHSFIYSFISIVNQSLSRVVVRSSHNANGMDAGVVEINSDYDISIFTVTCIAAHSSNTQQWLGIYLE